MDKIAIVCPSRRRPKVLTDIAGMILCVDKKEKDEYAAHNDREIINHDGLGNLSAIRQFLYHKFGNIFMVDDDIVTVEALYQTAGAILDPETIKRIIQKAHSRAAEIGAYLFGFNNDPSPTHYNQHKPFVLNSYINGCAIGLRKGSGLYFDERTTACESHWINLLNAYHHRFCFIDKRFHFRQKTDSTFKLPGGQTGKRTLETEKADTIFLKKMFGDSVKLKTERNQTKQLHQHHRELNIRL